MSKDSSAKYNQNNKERLHKKACKRYQSFSKEEKGKKQQYSRERRKNLPEDEKKLVFFQSIGKKIIKWENVLL